MRTFCYNCAAALHTEAVVCPHCGYDSRTYHPEPHHLLPETVLAGRYRIGRVLGGGGFGITYVGVDTVLDLKVAVKEFYMTGYVSRESLRSPEVHITGGTYGEDFIRNRNRFLDEARVLARFASEPGIVMVRDFFTANNTAYIVMEFLDGETLAAYLKKAGKLTWEKTYSLLRPVLETLSRIHRHDIIHRDISPDNIMMTKNGQIKLLDFGAAREFAGEANHSLSVILKHGYAPVEQNSRNRGIQGPWTDVYALCATMYRCLTGSVPEDAMERVNEDTVKTPWQMGRCSRPVSDVLMKGLALRRKDRWQSAEELIAALEQANTMPADRPFFVPPPPPEDRDATIYAGGAASGSDATVFAGHAAKAEPKAADQEATAYAGKAAAPKQPPKAAPQQPKAAPKQNVPPKQEPAKGQGIDPSLFSEFFGNSAQAAAFGAKTAAEKPSVPKAAAAPKSSVPKSAAAKPAAVTPLAPPAKAQAGRGLKVFGLILLALFLVFTLLRDQDSVTWMKSFLEVPFGEVLSIGPYMICWDLGLFGDGSLPMALFGGMYDLNETTLAVCLFPVFAVLLFVSMVLNYCCLVDSVRKPGKQQAARKKRIAVYSLVVIGITAAVLLIIVLCWYQSLWRSLYAKALIVPVFMLVLTACFVNPPSLRKRRMICAAGLLLCVLFAVMSFPV